jgi:hypothetical protein
VRSKAVLGMLALFATLALSATAAHAGNGGLPSALTSFFACYSTTNTKDSGQTVDLQNAVESPIAIPDRDPLVPADVPNVRIGSGSLVCTIIRALVPSKAKQQILAEPDPTQTLKTGGNAIKCYSVTGPGGTLFSGPSGKFSLTDTIWGDLGALRDTVPACTLPDGSACPLGNLDTEKNVTISQLKYICGPAIIGQ